ncbi:TetR/AcrR family transcriptional regulator [Xanthobacteraceae bacterium A53D]
MTAQKTRAKQAAAKEAPAKAATRASAATPDTPAEPRPLTQRLRTSRTKERILEAAHAAFVAGGFDGANIEAIANAAGVNKTLVYRHFTSKDDLFTVVLENAYLKMRGEEKLLALEALEPTDAIVKLIRFSWTYYLENPDLLALVATENQCQGRHLATSARFPSHASQLMRTLEETIGRGIAQGTFRADADAVQLWVSISAMSWFYVANRYTLEATFGQKMMSAAMRRTRLQHITDMVLRDLTAHGAKTAPGKTSPGRTATRPRKAG